MSPYVYRGTQPDLEPVVPHIPRKGKPGPKPKPLVFDPSKCGSHKGYKQHQRHGVEICDGCRKANADYHRDWRAAQPPRAPKERAAGVFDPACCGTPQGYDRHVRNNTRTCLPCRAAHTERHRTYRATRKAAA